VISFKCENMSPKKNYVLDIEKEIECLICYSIMKDPEEITVCGHSFCKSCLKDVLQMARRNKTELQ